MSTHNLCFRAKIRIHVYPCKPQFYYIKVGCKGVNITRTCLHDGLQSAFGRHHFLYTGCYKHLWSLRTSELLSPDWPGLCI